CVPVGEIVEGKVLVGGQAAARDAHTHHELPYLVVAALLAFGGAVAVVALIDAVEFEEAVARVVERRRCIGEIARKIAAQLPALLLDRLGFRDGFDRSHATSLRRVSRPSRWRGRRERAPGAANRRGRRRG